GTRNLANGRSGIFSVALSVNQASTWPPGRYPAHCSAEFGLSSITLDERQRPSGPATNLIIIFDVVRRALGPRRCAALRCGSLSCTGLSAGIALLDLHGGTT